VQWIIYIPPISFIEIWSQQTSWLTPSAMLKFVTLALLVFSQNCQRQKRSSSKSEKLTTKMCWVLLQIKSESHEKRSSKPIFQSLSSSIVKKERIRSVRWLRLLSQGGTVRQKSSCSTKTITRPLISGVLAASSTRWFSALLLIMIGKYIHTPRE